MERHTLKMFIKKREDRTQIETRSTSITLTLVGVDVIADFLCQPVSGSYHGVEDNLGTLRRIGWLRAPPAMCCLYDT